MNNYRFSAGSSVSDVAFRSGNDRKPIAQIIASKEADTQKLSTLRNTLEQAGWLTVPSHVNEQDVLEVRGFTGEQKLISTLMQNGFVNGIEKITHQQETEDTLNKRTILQKFFQHYSLQLAGILNLVGDVGFLGNGIKNNDTFKVAGGSLYTVGGANLALFGKVKPEQNIDDVTNGIAEVIKKSKGDLKNTSLASAIAQHPHNSTANANSFLNHNSAQNTLVAYTAGAGAMLASGIKKHQAGLGSAGLYYGLTSFVLKSLSLLIPEKPIKDELPTTENDTKNTGIINKTINWVREKPLRLFGYGSLATDSLLALDAYQEYKRHPEKGGYAWTGLTTASYIMADLMMAISNKDPANAGNRFNEEEQRTIEALAADAIKHQPKDSQESMILQVSEFLAARPEMSGDVSAIHHSIKELVNQLDSNPWVNRVKANTPIERVI